MRRTLRRGRAPALALLLIQLISQSTDALDIKQAATTVKVTFLMVSSTDGTTPVTGLTPTVTISKNGGAFASPTGTVAEVANGWYALTPSAADTGTVGDLIVHATGAGASAADRVVTIVAYDPNDAAALGLSAVPISMTTAVPASPTTGTTGAAMAWASGKVGRLGTAQAGSATTITLDSGASAVDNTYKDHAIKLTGGTGSGQFATIASYVGSTKVATVTRPAGNWSTTPDATTTFLIEPIPQVDLLAAQTFSTTGAVGSVTSPVTAGTVSDKTGYALTQAFPANFAGLTIASGKVAATVASGDAADLTTLLSRITAAPPTLAQIVAGIWNEPKSGHTTSGTYGLFLDSAVSGVSTGGVSAAAIATAVWQDLLTGSDFATTSSIGALLKANATPSFIPTGAVVAGSTTSAVTVSGLPVGASYLGQNLDAATGERRVIATQSFASGNYTFGFTGNSGTVTGPFSSASVATGVVVKIVP